MNSELINEAGSKFKILGPLIKDFFCFIITIIIIIIIIIIIQDIYYSNYKELIKKVLIKKF